MVEFAGWSMPVQFAGIIAEHTHTRAKASLFDVSHMGQLAISGRERISAIERLVPGDIAELPPGRLRYTMLTNDTGGIIDDLMVANADDYLFLVVNAARRDVDLARLRANVHGVIELADRALLALQGPLAAGVLERLAPGVDVLPFMGSGIFDIDGVTAIVSRSGYTGEDGFEISVPWCSAVRVARRLLAEPEVASAGLGARDTLRLEAGLCLWGHDIDENTTPVEAGLAWTIGKRRRAKGDYPGAATIARQLSAGPERQLVGIKLDGRVPAREHAQVTDASGAAIGTVTSGGYGPTIGGPIALGYVDAAHAEPGTEVGLAVRGQALPGRIVKLPFVPHRYAKGAGS
jgi:aminomethyltransferase